MMVWRTCVVKVLFCLAFSEGVPFSITIPRDSPRGFPEGFQFGTATSAYQIEGAWNVDGKGISMWDYQVHLTPSRIRDESTGDDAAKSYYLYERDVEMLRELGVDFYRFSLSWPRILPTGFSNQINQAGVDYYNRLIDELLKYNIQPVITIYHWDLPQRFQDLGGWANPSSVDWFGEYSRVVYSLFGDRVKQWVTINEPTQICYFGYGHRLLAPFVDFKGVGDYMCSKNVLLAHARAYHIYDEEFRASQGGSAFISLSSNWYEAESAEHNAAASEVQIFYLDQYAYPIFSKTGDWHPVLKQKIASKSAEQGFLKSRLPEFTEEEVEYVRGTSDYFGLNHYSTSLVYRNASVFGVHQVPSFEDDMGVITHQLDEWQFGESTFTKIVPWGFYKLLTYIREQYDNPAVYVTENGFSSGSGWDDEYRVLYYRGYLGAMLDAIEEGSDIRAYTAWSLMDNFEWAMGYTERFGLYEVDFTSEERTRTPRRSALIYKEMLRTRTLDLTYEPDRPVSAPNDEGKGISVWDYRVHSDPSPILDKSTGDDAAKSYYLYERDVEILRELGVDFYRFSLSWTRILPTGFPNQINQAGVDYYNRLINELLKYNIKPVITIYHWDLPQRFQDLGGWVNPSSVDWFGDYSRVAYTLFGDRVKHWVTINEPMQICFLGYGHTFLAPGLNFKGVAEYMCDKNVLLAHAKAYHIYDIEFRNQQGGIAFISLSSEWYEPESDEHVKAAAETQMFFLDHYAHPIFSKTGDWHPVLKQKIASKSAEQGFLKSRLPEFTEKEVEYVRGTSDYFGLNHYTTKLVYRNASVIGVYQVPSFEDDMGVITHQLTEWQFGESMYTKIVPWGFYKLLTYIREQYDNPAVYVTENGFSSGSGWDDEYRVLYYRGYLGAMLDAIEEGSDIRAYTAWSLMDNFEWAMGYTERFGLYEVDFASEERTRTPRRSALIYKEMLRTRTLDLTYEPDRPDVIAPEDSKNSCHAIQNLSLFLIFSNINLIFF